jgi:hypothetical protein
MSSHSPAPSNLKQKFQDWATIIGFFVDLIAIWGLFRFQKQVEEVQQATPPGIPGHEFKVFGVFPISYVIIGTGIFTLFVIASLIYRSYLKSKASGDVGSYIPAVALGVCLGWFYLRLWLGEYGLLLFLFVVVLIGVLINYFLFKTTVEDKYRIGCLATNAILGLVFFFLCLATGAAGNTLNTMASPPATTSDPVLVQAPQGESSNPFPTLVVTAETSPTPEPFSAGGYNPHELPAETWFPRSSEIREGFVAHNIREVTNEMAADGDAGTLGLFQSWGRITSYDRFYSHPEGCNSPDVYGVYIQIFFFHSPEGSQGFYDWAHEGFSVKFSNAVGDEAYIYSTNRVEGGCQTDIVATTFQHESVIGRARVYGVDGKMDQNALEALSLQISQILDGRLSAEAK